jgi:hypothetical protein
MTDRKKPGVAFWATVVMVALLVVYPLSFGPACWTASRDQSLSPLDRSVSQVYWPIGWLGMREGILGDTVLWYAKVGMENEAMVSIPIDASGHLSVIFPD